MIWYDQFIIKISIYSLQIKFHFIFIYFNFIWRKLKKAILKVLMKVHLWWFILKYSTEKKILSFFNWEKFSWFYFQWKSRIEFFLKKLFLISFRHSQEQKSSFWKRRYLYKLYIIQFYLQWTTEIVWLYFKTFLKKQKRLLIV